MTHQNNGKLAPQSQTLNQAEVQQENPTGIIDMVSPREMMHVVAMMCQVIMTTLGKLQRDLKGSPPNDVDLERIFELIEQIMETIEHVQPYGLDEFQKSQQLLAQARGHIGTLTFENTALKEQVVVQNERIQLLEADFRQLLEDHETARKQFMELVSAHIAIAAEEGAPEEHAEMFTLDELRDASFPDAPPEVLTPPLVPGTSPEPLTSEPSKAESTVKEDNVEVQKLEQLQLENERLTELLMQEQCGHQAAKKKLEQLEQNYNASIGDHTTTPRPLAVPEEVLLEILPEEELRKEIAELRSALQCFADVNNLLMDASTVGQQYFFLVLLAIRNASQGHSLNQNGTSKAIVLAQEELMARQVRDIYIEVSNSGVLDYLGSSFPIPALNGVRIDGKSRTLLHASAALMALLQQPEGE